MAEKKVSEKKKTGLKKVEKLAKEKLTPTELKIDLKRAEIKSVEKALKKTETREGDSKAKLSKQNKLKSSQKKHSKKYRKTLELLEIDKVYGVEEAITLIEKTATVNFDAAVESHIRLNIDLANSDQQVRGSLVLPAGTGKTKKVLAIVSLEKEKEAKESGADFVGGAELIAKIEQGWLDFEVVVATPDMMSSLGKIGKILGTKGLMPNPKVGTVTNDIGKVVKNLKTGMIEYRPDKNGIIHSVIGRVSFSEVDLAKNYQELIDTIIKAKPSGVKGTYLKSIYLTTTMGPSLKVVPK